MILQLARLLVVYGFFVGESLHMGSVLGGLSMNLMMLEMVLESSPKLVDFRPCELASKVHDRP